MTGPARCLPRGDANQEQRGEGRARHAGRDAAGRPVCAPPDGLRGSVSAGHPSRRATRRRVVPGRRRHCAHHLRGGRTLRFWRDIFNSADLRS